MTTNKLAILVIVSIIFLSRISDVEAHPGRTAADGCHYCRTNCDRWGVPWNERHCHGGTITQDPPVVAPKDSPTPKPTIFTPKSTPTPSPSPSSIPSLSPAPTNPIVTNKPETLGVQVKGESGNPWGGLLILGLIAGLLYWGFRKIKGILSKNKTKEE